MSTYSERAMKKMTPSSRLRGTQSGASSSTGPSQTASQAPVKDPYDFDFIDEAPAPAKSRLVSLGKPAIKPATATATATTPLKLPSAPPRPSLSASKSFTNTQRSTATRTAAPAPEPARSLKRKPSQLDAARSQRPTGHGATSSAAPASRYPASPVKRVQHRSSSPDPIAVAISTSSSQLGKRTASARTSASSTIPTLLSYQSAPARLHASKTPPRTTATAQSPYSMRSPTASPRKTPATTPSAAKPVRNPVSATPASASRTPYRSTDTPLLGSTTKPASAIQSASKALERVTAKVAATPNPPVSRPMPSTRYTPSTQPSTRKRRRLIDTLAEQIEEESSSEEDEPSQEADAGADAGADDGSSEAETILAKYKNIRSTPLPDDRAMMELESILTGSPSKPQLASSTPASITRTKHTRRKFVYNVQRTMLAEEPATLDSQGSDLSMLESLLPEPEPKADAYDMDDDMSSQSQGANAIQSIHELRQAGANSRFADELVDIMDRVGAPSVGKPNSSRRGALVELAQKIQEKTFLRQFRDQGADMKLFHDIGKETDTIAGFSIACIVVLLFSSGSVTPRLLREFQQQKIKDMFAGLLTVGADIEAVTKSRDLKDRKNRTSPHMSQQLVGLREKMKKNLAAWKPATVAPAKLSPRTVTLKALHLFAQQLQISSGGVITGLDENEGALSTELTKQLFQIISAALPSPYDDDDDGIDNDKKPAAPSIISSGLTSDPTSADVYLSLALLEMHSVSAMQSDISAEWTQSYLPIIASALDDSLVRYQQEQQEQQENQKQQEQEKKESHERGLRLNDLELLVLKLALNTANNNPDGARFYVERGLLRRLAELSSVSLAEVVRAAKAGEGYSADALNELLLMLGVMINFSENDSAAGETLAQGMGGLLLLDKLGKTFLDGRAIAAEADSEEKSQLNVAFAYLSILLGYLCLHEPIYDAFRKLTPSRSVHPLLESIRQFMALHEQLHKTENAEAGAEASHFTARLRALAHELEVRAY